MDYLEQLSEYQEFCGLPNSYGSTYRTVETKRIFDIMNRKPDIESAIPKIVEILKKCFMGNNAISKAIFHAYAKTGVRIVIDPDMFKWYINMYCPSSVKLDESIEHLVRKTAVVCVGDTRRYIDSLNICSIQLNAFRNLVLKYHTDPTAMPKFMDVYTQGRRVEDKNVYHRALSCEKSLASWFTSSVLHNTYLHKEHLDVLFSGLVEQDFRKLYVAHALLFDDGCVTGSQEAYLAILASAIVCTYCTTGRAYVPLGVKVDTLQSLADGVVSVTDWMGNSKGVQDTVYCLHIPANVADRLLAIENESEDNTDVKNRLCDLHNEIISYSENKGITLIEVLDDVREKAPEVYKNGSLEELLLNTWDAYLFANN